MTNGEYKFTSLANSGPSATIIVGGTASVATSLQNTGTGTQDALNVSGVAPAANGGSINAGTAASSGSLAQGLSVSSSGYTFTSSATGAYTISASSGTSVANVTAAGTPIVGSARHRHGDRAGPCGRHALAGLGLGGQRLPRRERHRPADPQQRHQQRLAGGFRRHEQQHHHRHGQLRQLYDRHRHPGDGQPRREPGDDLHGRLWR